MIVQEKTFADLSSSESEKGVLGCIVIAPDDIALVADMLRPEHFYQDKHRAIYAAMMHLYERRKDCDQFSVCDLLERQGKLEQVGGSLYIGLLANTALTSMMVEKYAKRVIDEWKRRRLREAGHLTVNAAHTAEDIDTAILQAEEAIYGISHEERSRSVMPIRDVVYDFINQFEMLPDGGTIVGVPTGLHEIDRLTGGLQKSDLIILAGRPAMGKTAMCLTIARNAAMDYGRNVLIFSLEMARQQLIQRLTAHEARVNLHRLRMRQTTSEEYERVIAVSGPISEAPIWIDDTPGNLLIAMQSKLRREMAKHDIDLVIVDYLGKVQATIDGKRIKERYHEVSEVARGLKDMAREFNVPVLALAQLNRDVESRQVKIPQLADLRDSGEIEQEADIVAFIHRDDYYAGKEMDGRSKSNRPGTADIVFAKHRNGEVGDVVLGFEESQTRFYNIEVQ